MGRPRPEEDHVHSGQTLLCSRRNIALKPHSARHHLRQVTASVPPWAAALPGHVHPPRPGHKLPEGGDGERHLG